MKNLRPFQIVLLALFGIFAVIALILLSNYSPEASDAEKKYGDEVLIWGTLDADVFRSAFNEINSADKAFSVVEYERIDLRSFNDTFVNAVAEGRSPDLILIPSSELVRQRSKLLGLTYETIPLRTFMDTYLDGAEIYTFQDGVFGIPFVVDPIVLYWNRDIFAENGFAQPPSTWEQAVGSVIPAITRRDNSRTILQSAVAFGEVRNVQNAKEVLLLLAMQSGSKMVHEDGNRYAVELNRSTEEKALPPLESAVQFFTNFSNSNSALYSWNRQQPLDRNAFVAENLAMYFGFGSESADLEGQNPNLNFDAAPVPQGASATARRTYGEFYAFAIPKASKNPQGAFLAASTLALPQNATMISEMLGMAPAQRSAIAAGSPDPFRQIIFNAALIARGWLDPNSSATDGIFEDMVEDITSGRESLNSAVSDGEQKIRLTF